MMETGGATTVRYLTQPRRYLALKRLWHRLTPTIGLNMTVFSLPGKRKTFLFRVGDDGLYLEKEGRIPHSYFTAKRMQRMGIDEIDIHLPDNFTEDATEEKGILNSILLYGNNHSSEHEHMGFDNKTFIRDWGTTTALSLTGFLCGVMMLAFSFAVDIMPFSVINVATSLGLISFLTSIFFKNNLYYNAGFIKIVGSSREFKREAGFGEKSEKGKPHEGARTKCYPELLESMGIYPPVEGIPNERLMLDNWMIEWAAPCSRAEFKKTTVDIDLANWKGYGIPEVFFATGRRVEIYSYDEWVQMRANRAAIGLSPLFADAEMERGPDDLDVYLGAINSTGNSPRTIIVQEQDNIEQERSLVAHELFHDLFLRLSAQQRMSFYHLVIELLCKYNIRSEGERQPAAGKAPEFLFLSEIFDLTKRHLEESFLPTDNVDYLSVGFRTMCGEYFAYSGTLIYTGPDPNIKGNVPQEMRAFFVKLKSEYQSSTQRDRDESGRRGRF